MKNFRLYYNVIAFFFVSLHPETMRRFRDTQKYFKKF